MTKKSATRLDAIETTSPPSVKVPSTSTASKKARLIGMLHQPDGSTIAEISAALGWRAHTTRAAITGLRKAGSCGRDGKAGGWRCGADLPHLPRARQNEWRGERHGSCAMNLGSTPLVLRVTAKDLPSTVAVLESADRADLLDLWGNLIGSPAPKNLSVPFLRRALAFEVQCQLHGGPKSRTLEDLGRIASGNESHASVGARLRPGAKLMREWQGRTWTVEVIEGGFLMGGERYASLSALARKITGARWSGPRFFGLTAAGAEADAAPAGTSHRRKAA